MIRAALLCLVLVGSLASFPAEGSPDPLWDAPWRDSSRALVLDAYGPNALDFNALASDSRVVGIFHKATDASTRKTPRKDSAYHARAAEARARGYLWGAYHLGGPGNAIAQADSFLAFVRPDSLTALALDLEDVTSSAFMGLDSARAFIRRMVEKTGRYPFLYGNHATLRAITEQFPGDTLFGRCPLWYARFRTQVVDFTPGVWDHYSLWQFQSEINCTRSDFGDCAVRVPGVLHDMDINVFGGTAVQLRAWWPGGNPIRGPQPVGP